MQRGVACGTGGTDASTTTKDASRTKYHFLDPANLHRPSFRSYFISTSSSSALSCVVYNCSLGTFYSNHLPCVYPLFTVLSLLRCGVFGPESLRLLVEKFFGGFEMSIGSGDVGKCLLSYHDLETAKSRLSPLSESFFLMSFIYSFQCLHWHGTSADVHPGVHIYFEWSHCHGRLGLVPMYTRVFV